MKTQVIIIDLDGTAVDSPTQKLPSRRLVDAVSRLQERYHISSATGRVWTFAKPILQSLGLVDPCIISAGTQICNPRTGEILWQKNLADTALGAVLEVFRQYPDYKLLYNDGTEDDYFNGGVYPKDFASSEPIYFLEQVFVPDTIAEEIQQTLVNVPEITCVMVPAQKPHTRDLHVINQHATKEHAISELLKLLHIDSSATIGVGDGYNDVHLFNAVGRKIAMGNAVEPLKAIADEVIGSVKDDGLAKFFEQL